MRDGFPPQASESQIDTGPNGIVVLKLMTALVNVLVNINGQLCSPADAKISVFDRGFLFGDGVYETGRSLNRCCLYLEEHLARLRRSAERLAIEVPFTDLELKNRLYTTARAFKRDELYFRIIMTRGVISHVGLDVMEEVPPTLVIIVQELPSHIEALRKKGLKLLTSKIIRNAPAAQDPNIKTSNYLNSLLALQEVKKRGGEDAVLCDASGNVTEGTTFALFGVKEDGTLITASLDVGILDSITRRHVIQLASKKYPVSEGRIPLKIFQQCKEVFIASSVRDIISVREWDGHAYSLPAKQTDELLVGLQAGITEYVRSGDKY